MSTEAGESRFVTLDVIAIVVSYHPDLSSLEDLLDALLPQVATIMVVDNGSSVEIAAWSKHRYGNRVVVIPLGNNRGIAAAQNVGINWARNQGARYVVLFDQDSIPVFNTATYLFDADALQ